MAAWRVLLRNLYDLNRAAPVRDFADWSFSLSAELHAIQALRERGLIRSNGLIGKHATWRITDLGREVVEGRVIDVMAHPDRPSARAMRFVATWLRSLPRVNFSDAGFAQALKN